MTPTETATATASAVSGIGSRFMLDPDTYARGGSLGFDGIDFYFAGRGGALGDVDADVVAAAFFFFEPDRVRASWEASAAVMPRRDAALAFAACLEPWSARVPDEIDCARLAELTGRIVTAANPAGAPVFAGWRQLPEPGDPKALACHRLNALRELRLGLHGGAVLATGLRPLEALVVRTPYMAPVFGWSGELPDAAPCEERWQAAERATDEAFGVALAVLSDTERTEWAELTNAVDHATAT